MMVIMRPIRLTKAELCVQLCVQTRRVCQPNTCLYAVLKRFESFVIVSFKTAENVFLQYSTLSLFYRHLA